MSLLEVLSFAAKAHRNQRSKGKDKEPYINHPIEVAKLVSESLPFSKDKSHILSAALLHHVIEDIDVTIEQIRDLFGEYIANIVSEVTDDRRADCRELNERNIK